MPTDTFKPTEPLTYYETLSFCKDWYKRYSQHRVGLHTARQFLVHKYTVCAFNGLSFGRLVSRGWFIVNNGMVRLTRSGVNRVKNSIYFGEWTIQASIHPQRYKRITLNLTRAEKHHLKPILAIEKEAFTFTPQDDPVNLLKTWLKEQQVYVLLSGKNGEEVVGYSVSGLSPHPNESERGYIFAIAIKADYRRQGFGRLLLNKTCDLLCKLGATKIDLDVRESNIRARNLYEKLGFKRYSIRENLYPDGENSVIYLKYFSNQA